MEKGPRADERGSALARPFDSIPGLGRRLSLRISPHGLARGAPLRTCRETLARCLWGCAWYAAAVAMRINPKATRRYLLVRWANTSSSFPLSVLGRQLVVKRRECSADHVRFNSTCRAILAVRRTACVACSAWAGSSSGNKVDKSYWPSISDGNPPRRRTRSAAPAW